MVSPFRTGFVAAVAIAALAASAIAQPFTDTGNSLTSTRETFLAAADFDGDGDIDLFAGENGDGDTVWLNDGTGSFTDTAQDLGANAVAQDAVAGLLDGDAFPDVVCPGGPTRVYFNDGNGNFTPSGQSFPNAQTAIIGDVDGINGNDIIFGVNGNERVYLNDGTGNFTATGQFLNNSTYTMGLVLADFDGDSDLDLYFGNNDADKVFLNNGNGIFYDSGQSLNAETVRYAAGADLDGDGDIDIFVANTTAANVVYFNDGHGNFTASAQVFTATTDRRVALADFDRDGDVDALVAAQNGNHKIWLNDGAGTFTNAGAGISVGFTNDCEILDIDGDGDADFVCGQVQTSHVFRNNGAPNVASIARADASPTAAATVNFTVTFDRKVSGVDVADFIASTASGTVTGAFVSAVAGAGATYTVTVNTGTGVGDFGELRLDVTDDDSILAADAGQSPLGGTGTGNGDFSTGETYTIDRVGPNVTVEQAAAQADPSMAGSLVNFTVTFDEAVSGFDTADLQFDLTNFAGTMADISSMSVTGGPTVFTASFAATNAGTIALSVMAGGVQDAHGNTNAASTSTDNAIEFLAAKIAVAREGVGIVGVDDIGTLKGKSATVTLTYTVTNIGGTDLTLTTAPGFAGITGVSADIDFAGTLTLAPNASETFSVTLTPKQNGQFSATIEICSDDPDAGTLTFAIEGTATDTGTDRGAVCGLVPGASLPVFWLLGVLLVALFAARCRRPVSAARIRA